MIRIDDLNELSALHKALLAAKFSGKAENDELAGDPTFAGLTNRVYDEMSKHQDKKVLDAAALEELRRIKTSQGYRGQWRTAVMAARRDPMLASAEKDERLTIAKCLLSPFTCTEGELRAFLDAVDGKTGEHDLGKISDDLAGSKLIGISYSFEEKQAHCVFMLKGMRFCDMYFSQVRKFVFDYGKNDDSDSPEMPDVKKIAASSGKTHELTATLSGRYGKIALEISSFGVDYWL